MERDNNSCNWSSLVNGSTNHSSYQSWYWLPIWSTCTLNIFILDNDPVKAAQQQCDKHIVKMVLESAQMLSSAHRILDGELERRPSLSGKTNTKYYKLPDKREDTLYKAVHFNHPCSIWTRESQANYDWHYLHFIALCKEYEYRYDKVHMCYTKLADVLYDSPNNIANKPQTPFAIAMGSNPECILDDAIESYKSFYQAKQANFKMLWSKRPKPTWFQYV